MAQFHLPIFGARHKESSMTHRPNCAFLRQSVRKRIKSISQSYIEDAKWLEDFPFDEILSQKRVPVTKEFMATSLAAEMKGDSPPHPAKEHFREALYESIVRLVGDLSHRYSFTCVDNTDDLMQDCMLRVWKKLENYDSSKGKFSTWVWYVCKSVLNRKYSKSKKYRSVFVPQGENVSAPEREHHYGDILAHEFAGAVRELAQRFPEKGAFIYEVFGNPNTPGYIPPRLVRIAESARNIGMRRSEATSFYTRVVRPFMRDRFKHERSSDGKTDGRTKMLRGAMGSVGC